MLQYSEFLNEFHRLCQGFDYKAKPAQLSAFYERLKLADPEDWKEAVTDLLCAPKFPYSIEAVWQAIEKRRTDRLRARAEWSRMQRVNIPATANELGFVECPDEVREQLVRMGLMRPKEAVQ